MDSPLAELIRVLLSRHWFFVLCAAVASVYVLVFLWKIIRSEEGFLFGYGNWIIGKWRSVSRGDFGRRPDPQVRRPLETQGEPPGRALAASAEQRLNVLRFSRVVDMDIAHLLVSDSSDWAPRIQQSFQMIVSGMTRVVHPVGKCRCGLFVLDEDEKHLILAAGEGYALNRRPRLELERSCAGRSFLTGDKYYCRDILTDPVYYHQSSQGRRDFRSIACVPVRTGQHIFGVLCMDAEEADTFTEDDFIHLQVFAAKLAVLCAFYSLQAGGSCEL